MRADLDRKRHRIGIAVDNHDAHPGDRGENLNPYVSQSACADHDAGVTGPCHPCDLGGRVIGRQTGIRESRDIGRLERIVDLHDAARGGLQVVGVTAVGVDAGELVVLAVHVVACAAGTAQATRDQRMQDHLVAHRHIGDGVADRLDPSGILMPDRVRQFDAALLGPLPFENVQIGAAHSGATDPHDHVEWTGHHRIGDLGELQLVVVADNLYGSHDDLPVVVAVRDSSNVGWRRSVMTGPLVPSHSSSSA